MTPERWSLIGRVFDRAVQLPPPERGAYLDGACAGDPALRREVDSLLHAYACSEGPDLPVLPRPAVREPGETGDRGRRLVPGERVGAYRVVQELGAGGMGVVYLGRRDDDRYRREVAIKVLHLDLGGRSARLRFRTECQILAALEHPNIARLYDAGELADGSPYFVMERVEGERIDEHAARLPLPARLRLFQKVCHAVHSAHQHLVVHRDIKPGNILVTADGEPKLLDFGIAKLVAPWPSPERDLTRTGMRPMTPEYASPEQILGEPVTTASDVYSLGMLLYRLLVGRLPPPDDRLSAAELGRLVAGGAAGDEPVGSVRRGTEVAGGGPRPSACAGTAALRRQLRGDLDGIVLMALQRRPGERYGSAEQLADDVGRHLAGLPVRARTATLSYRAGRFLRRHWISFAAATAFVALLASATVVTLFQAAQVRHQRQKAEEVLAFFVDLFEVSNPDEPVGDRVTARELLDQGVERARRELDAQPDIQATLLETMGVIYGKLGRFDAALPLVEEALQSRRRRLGPDHPDVAASLHDLAVLLRGTGEWQRSEALLREALESRRRLLGSEHPEVAETLYRLAEVRLDRMGFADAEGFATEALEVRRRVYGDEHREVVASLGQVAESLRAQGRFDEAAPVLEESLAVKRRLLGPRHPEVATTLSDLANLRYDQGRYAEAERPAREALELRREVWGEEHPQVAVSLGHLARVLEAKGDLEEAEVHHRAAIEIERHLGHEKHPDFATMVNNLGVLKRRAGDFAAAEALLRQAYELRLEVLDEGHPYLCQSQFSLADVLHEQGKLDEAEALYRGAIRVCARILPARHHNQAWAKLGLGRLLSDRGRPEASEPLLREALSLLVGSLPAEHWRIAEAESAMARNLALQARPGEAAALLVPAHRRLEAQLGADHRATRRAEAWLRELQGRD